MRERKISIIQGTVLLERKKRKKNKYKNRWALENKLKEFYLTYKILTIK